jgi:hypothetical protein
VSLMTKTQATEGGAAIKARAGAARARVRAQRAAAQAAPLAASAAATARQGVYRARVWTAPRLDRTGQTLEKQVAPKMAAMLSSAASRIDPAPARRRRWPFVAGGLVLAAALSGAAAYLLTRRASSKKRWGKVTDAPIATPPSDPATQPAPADVNGRIHTP